MLIPIYVLIGVWGGPRRLRATATFVIYTMAGSLLMLASIVVFGLSQDTFSLVDSGVSSNDWVFLGFLVAFAVKAPIFPFHGWLVDAYRESPPEVAAILSGVVSKAAVYGLLRIVIAKFPEPVDDFQSTILAFATIGLVYASLLAFRAPDIRGVTAYSSMAQMGLITIGPLLAQRARRSTARSSSRSRTGSSRRRSSCSRGWSSCAPARARSPASAGWRAGGPCSRRC